MLPYYTQVSEPAIEPVTNAELLDFIKADASDTTLITSLGAVAREFVESQTGRAMITQTWQQIRPAWICNAEDDYKLFLERTPLASVTSIKYYPADGGAQLTLSSSVYRVITAGNDRVGWVELDVGQDWPDVAERSDAIEITFVAGVADASSVRRQLRHAILLLAKHLYDTGRDPVNAGNANAGKILEVPYTLRDMISAQRVWGWFS
jgi:uncharacterized phiE125 gp8 family phage protein